MGTFRILITAILFTLALLLACSIDAQCTADTIPPGPPHPPLRDTTAATGNPLPCFTPACGPCATSATCTIFPLDGCILIGGDEGWIGATIRDSCNLVLLDTCFFVIPDAAIFGELCFSYPHYSLLTLCRDTVAPISVEYVPGFGTGWPLLQGIVNLDTLCPPITSIARPQLTQIPSSGYTDMRGRYWHEQPVGISFSWALHRKVLRIR